MTMSAPAASRRTRSWPSGWRRSMQIERLLRACTDHQSEVPDGSSGQSLRHLRSGSPPSPRELGGGSTLITSAPKSAIMRAAKGPAISCPSSITRSPRSAPALVSIAVSIGISVDVAPVAQGMGDGARVDVLELAAHRHAPRQPGDAQPARAQHLPEVVGGGLALLGEVGGEDHLGDDAVAGAREQALEMDVVRPHALDGRE